MLTSYIDRAGKALDQGQRARQEAAKNGLRALMAGRMRNTESKRRAETIQLAVSVQITGSNRYL